MSLFITKSEEMTARQFLEQGYIIHTITHIELFEQIRQLVAESAASFLNCSVVDQKTFLNQIHEQVSLEQLNALRLNVIRYMNEQSWFRSTYFQLVRSALETVVGNELAMQLRVNLSIQLPKDDSSLLPVHADVWSGDSPYEVVVWLPLVDCYRTKAMYLLPPEADRLLQEEFDQYAGRSSEELFRRIEEEVDWIEIKAGEVLLFNQKL